MGIDRLAAQVAASGALSKAEKARRKDEAKKLRRAERRKAKQEADQKARHEIWEDREGKARPTPERRSKGSFVLRDGEDAGLTVAVDERPTMLDHLRAAGVITEDQCQGGMDFAALIARTAMVRTGRSCIDFSPVGHIEDEPTAQDEWDERERKELYLACGVATYRELWRVAVEGQPVRNIPRLRDGLDLCAKFWG